MARRINIMLGDATIKKIDRLAPAGHRSRFIERAVEHYIATASAAALEERLKEAAIRDRDLDLEIANDWYAVDGEQWRTLDRQEASHTRTTQDAAKSISLHSTQRSVTKSKKRAPR